MFLTILDLILILIIFLFIAFGFVTGFLGAIGSLVGLVVGTWAAGHFQQPLAEWLTPILLGRSTAASIIAFLLIFTVVNRAIGVLFWLLGKIFNLISIIPFTKSLNRILGAVLGLVEGVLATGIVLFFIAQLPVAEWYMSFIETSAVAKLLIAIASILTPLLPVVIEQVQTVL